MVIFNLMKQLKKKLRRKLKWISLGITVMIAMPIILNWSFNNESQPVFEPASNQGQFEVSNQSVFSKLKQVNQSRDVFIQKKYVCGEELQQVGKLSTNDILKLSKEHPDWEVILQESGQVYLTEHIQDLSTTCKEAAYFGIDESGVLSLFDGLPQQNKVIQTFFQLNIEYLKSALPPEAVQELYVGIRVTDLEEYNSVLSTFADYARIGVEQTMGTANPGH